MILPLIYIFYIIFYWNSLNLSIAIIWGVFFLLYIWAIYYYHQKSHKISPNQETHHKIRKLEIKNNIYSLIIYFFIIGWLFWAYQYDFFNFRFDINIWTFFEAIILVIFHDAYFFFLHKKLHEWMWYKKVHIDHHKSVYPTILSAYNFHPIEAILYTFAFIPAFFLDLNFYALLFAVFFNDFFNFIGHSGYEIFEKRPKHWIFNYIVTASYHDLHHTNNKWNYALYFSWWDKLYETYDKKYDEL